MADGINIEVRSDAVVEALERLRGRSADLSPAMEEVGAVFEQEVQLRFEAKTDPLGRSWAPHAAATRDAYARADAGRRAGTLLERTGRMRASLTWEADAQQVLIGFGQPHAQYHEFGTRRMPRRGLLMADPEAGTLAPADERRVLDVLEDYLRGAD